MWFSCCCRQPCHSILSRSVSYSTSYFNHQLRLLLFVYNPYMKQTLNTHMWRIPCVSMRSHAQSKLLEIILEGWFEDLFSSYFSSNSTILRSKQRITMQELNMSKNCIFVEKLYGLCDISYFLFNRRKNGNFRQSNFRRFRFEEVTTLKTLQKIQSIALCELFSNIRFCI